MTTGRLSRGKPARHDCLRRATSAATRPVDPRRGNTITLAAWRPRTNALPRHEAPYLEVVEGEGMARPFVAVRIDAGEVW